MSLHLPLSLPFPYFSSSLVPSLHLHPPCSFLALSLPLSPYLRGYLHLPSGFGVSGSVWPRGGAMSGGKEADIEKVMEVTVLWRDALLQMTLHT